ncbi:MAG: type VI secretion system lipoprotein TssJ [Myxococcota bacterium]
MPRSRPFSRPSVRLLALLAALTGCKGGDVCTKPEPANLWVSGADDMNLDPEGGPLPTLVRVYQLSSLGELSRASFADIMGNPQAVLGDTLLGTEEITVFPGKAAFRAFERAPGANYAVGVAAVRQPTGTSWRAVLPLPKCGRDSAQPMLRFFVEGYSIRGTVGREGNPEGCKDENAECLRERASEVGG